MTRDLVYVSHIRDALARIRTYTAGGKAAFMADAMVQDATIRNLEIIGEAAKRISADFRAVHSDVPWSRMAGMRDILIHNYLGVDLEIVWDVVARRLEKIEDRLVKTLAGNDP